MTGDTETDVDAADKKTDPNRKKLTNFSSLLEKHEETIPDGIPWFLASIIFVNALVGAGILNFPYSIHAAGGIYIAILVQMVMVVMLYFSVSTMVWCSHICKSSFYQDTVYEYLGAGGRYLCSVLILLYCYLLTTTYLVAIGQQLGAGVKILFGHNNHWYLSEPVLLMAVGIVIFPLLLVKSIDRLHIASAVASVTVLLVAGVVIYEYYHIDHGVPNISERPAKWTDVFLSVPAYAIAYMFDLASVAVYGRMKRKTVGNFMRASLLAMGSVFVFYNVFSIYAYLTFGDRIHPNFMTNYHEGTWVIAFAQFAYSFKLCLEYPVFQFLGWTAIRTFSAGCCGSTPDKESQEDTSGRFRFLSSLFWFLSTLLISLFASNINYVLPLASATVLHFQFTFPGLCLWRALHLVEDYLSRTKIYLLRIYGTVLVIFGFVLSTVLIVQYFTVKH